MTSDSLNRLTIVGTGMLAIIVFGALCVRHNVPAIEADLKRRATTELRTQRMGWARVTVDGRDLVIEGVAPDASAREQAARVAAVYGVRNIDNRAKTIEERIAAGDVEPPPEPDYRTHFLVGDGGLVLGGAAAGEQGRRELIRKAQEHFGVTGVEVRLRSVEGIAAHWNPASELALEVAEKLILGEVVINNETVRVSGLTYTADDEQQVRELFATRLPAEFEAIIELGSREEFAQVLRESPALAARLAQRQTPGMTIAPITENLTVEACRSRFLEAAGDRKVQFATASATLTEASQRLLDELSDALKLCPAVRLTIAGHTDDQGEEDNNLALSQKRAEAVMQYFVMRGISLSRLSAQGYGEEQPLVENVSAENRAINRRIEFVFAVQ